MLFAAASSYLGLQGTISAVCSDTDLDSFSSNFAGRDCLDCLSSCHVLGGILSTRGPADFVAAGTADSDLPTRSPDSQQDHSATAGHSTSRC